MDVYNTSKKLLPNMYADVNVPLPSNDSTFIVPKTAVVTSTEKVFIIRIKDGKAEWVNVQKGLEAGDNIEVYGKLNPGDQIVKAGSEEIRDGSTVKISNAKVAATDNNEGNGKDVSGPTGTVKPEKTDSAGAKGAKK